MCALVVALGDVEFTGDSLIAQAFCDECQYLLLSRGKEAFLSDIRGHFTVCWIKAVNYSMLNKSAKLVIKITD